MENAEPFRAREAPNSGERVHPETAPERGWPQPQQPPNAAQAQEVRTHAARSRPLRVRRSTPRLFLFLSLSLNVGLLLYFALVCRRPETVTVPMTDNTTGVSESEPTVRTDATLDGARTPSASRWVQLKSTNLALYAANLRTAGCPPKTVRNILLPSIEEEFKYPESTISDPADCWASFSQRQAAAAARTEQEIALRNKRDATVKELLGFAWNSDGLKQAYGPATAGSVGFLEYEHVEKLLCIAERLKLQFSRAERSHRIDHRSALYEAWKQEVADVLSPAEVEEAELRGILMIFQRDNPNLCNAGLNGSELRQLMVLRRELSAPLPSAFLSGSDALLLEPDSAGEQRFLAKARSLLGDTRFIDYLKACDVTTERTLGALENQHLPRSLALQLFDVREQAVARARDIRELPVRRAEKRTQLAALRQSAIEQLMGLSRASTESPLLRINQDWLQEIASP